MKRNPSIIALLALAFAVSNPMFPSPAAAESKTGDITNKSAQAVDFNAVFDTGEYRNVSAQAIYSDGTPASHSVVDGRKSTAKLTVSSLSNLTTSYATVQINVNNNSIPNGVAVVLNNQRLVAGQHFAIGTVSSMTAYNLAAAINAYSIFNSTHIGTPTNIVASATVVGIAPNSWTTATNCSSITFSSAFFSGGTDAASITLNGVTLTNGVEWFVGASSATTAASISAAIITSSVTSLVISSVTGPGANAGVVYATATLTGLNAYSVSSSTPLALAWTFPYFIGGLDPGISVADDSITKASHALTTGLKVYVSTSVAGSTMPTGLTGGATYFAIKTNDNAYKLATSSTNATAGTAVDITALTGNSTLSVYPLPLASGTGTGLGSFKWQGSNDNSNWTDLSVSSVTWSGTAGSTVWDFGDMAYRFLRLAFVGPINGGIRLLTYVNGKVAQ